MLKVIFLLRNRPPSTCNNKATAERCRRIKSRSIDDAKCISMRFMFFEYKEKSERRWRRKASAQNLIQFSASRDEKKVGSCIPRFHSLCRYTQKLPHKHIITKGRRKKKIERRMKVAGAWQVFALRSSSVTWVLPNFGQLFCWWLSHSTFPTVSFNLPRYETCSIFHRPLHLPFLPPPPSSVVS